MTTPSWQLGPRYWELASLRAGYPPPTRGTRSIYRTVLPSPASVERGTGGAIMDLKFALFNRWQEIDNHAEGHFLERLAPGVFRKSIKENLANIRAVLSHGKDPSIGSSVLGKIQSFEEQPDGAVARVSLFSSVPELLLEGLAAQQYGASFRGEPIKNHTVNRPGRSDYNPKGLPEVTRQEIRLRDIGPTPFAAYAGTSAQIQVMDAVPPARAQGRAKQLVRETAPSWQIGRSSSQPGNCNEGSGVPVRTSRTRPTIADLIDDDTMAVCVESFRPQAITRMIEKGQWLRLDHPAVHAHPERFAVRLTDIEGGRNR
jgi:phage head maturation protease